MSNPPVILRQVHERVFYTDFDENNEAFVQFIEWMAQTFVRDNLKEDKRSIMIDGVLTFVTTEPDLHLEDAGWPQTPPGVRLVFRTKEAAQKMIDKWQAYVFPQRADEKFMVSNPDIIMRPW